MIRQINIIQFRLIVIFIVFDGIRSNLIGGGYLSVIRECALLFLLLQVFVNRYHKKIVIAWSLMLFLSYHVTISLFSLINNGPVDYAFIFKPIEFVFVIFTFYYYKNLTGESINKLLRFLINTTIVFCVVNTICYFVPLPIWDRNSFWWGRISCGYPTMDVATLSYSLVILLYYPYLNYTKARKTLFLFLITIEIILNVSGTGMVLLCLILLSLIFVQKLTFKNILIAASFFFFIIASITYFAIKYPQKFELAYSLAENKVSILLGKEVSNNTMEVRDLQYKEVEKKHTLLTRITGMGLNYLVMDLKKLKKNRNFYHIENQYSILKIAYGYIGLILYLLVMVEYAYLVYRSPILLKLKIAFLVSLMIWAANSGTIITLMIFPNSMYLGLILALIYRFNIHTRTVKVYFHE